MVGPGMRCLRHLSAHIAARFGVVLLTLLAGRQATDSFALLPMPDQQTHGSTTANQPVSSAHPQPRSGAITVGAAQVEIPDIPVLNQDGKRLRLYTDLMKGKIVVLSFFFTSCVDVCPMQGMALSKLQTRLGERAGRDVFMVSVSKDPLTDTPQQLRKWADAYKVKRGWTLVTGDEETFRKLVRNFIGESLGSSSHLPVLLIGNDRTGEWHEAMSESKPEELVQLIDSLSLSDGQR